METIRYSVEEFLYNLVFTVELFKQIEPQTNLKCSCLLEIIRLYMLQLNFYLTYFWKNLSIIISCALSDLHFFWNCRGWYCLCQLLLYLIQFCFSLTRMLFVSFFWFLFDCNTSHHSFCRHSFKLILVLQVDQK